MLSDNPGGQSASSSAAAASRENGEARANPLENGGGDGAAAAGGGCEGVAAAAAAKGLNSKVPKVAYEYEIQAVGSALSVLFSVHGTFWPLVVRKHELYLYPLLHTGLVLAQFVAAASGR